MCTATEWYGKTSEIHLRVYLKYFRVYYNEIDTWRILLTWKPLLGTGAFILSFHRVNIVQPWTVSVQFLFSLELRFFLREDFSEKKIGRALKRKYFFGNFKNANKTFFSDL